MHRMNRLSSFAVVLASVFGMLASAASLVFAGEQRFLTVRESAGIRRFGYPVSVAIEVDPPASGKPRFRLMEGDRPVAAQFRTTGHVGDRCSQVTLDFDSSFLPFETKHYTLVWGDDETAGPEPDRGMAVTKNDRRYTISNQTFLDWTVDSDLTSLVRSVKTPDLEYVESTSPGLFLISKQNTRHWIGGMGDNRIAVESRVVREGTIACALSSDGTTRIGANGEEVKVHVDLEFPRSKSWIRVDYHVIDPRDEIAELGCELNLVIGSAPTLIDFGASSMVYATLRGEQQTVFSARPGHFEQPRDKEVEPRWRIEHGQPGKLEPYAICPPASVQSPEGWAHVMDDKRCTADRKSTRLNSSH